MRPNVARMSGPRQRSPVLDRPVARFAAAGLALAAAGGLLAIHWEDLFPPERQAAGGNPAFRACMDKRVGDIERMLEEGVVGERQAEQFRQRAEAFCRAQSEAGGPATGGPTLPGQ